MPLMRSLATPVGDKIDWSVLHDRHADDVRASGSTEEEEDEFDTRISGPWMRRWPIKHHNKHTALAGIKVDENSKG